MQRVVYAFGLIQYSLVRRDEPCRFSGHLVSPNTLPPSPDNLLHKLQVKTASTGSNQAYRTISTSQLSVLPRLHLWPIDEVVYLGPQGYLVLRGASRLDAFSGYPVRS